MREDQAYAMDQAIGAGDTAAVRRLLSGEPRLTGTPIPVERDWGEEMWLPLHRSAESGDEQIAGALLEAGASVDARTRFRTPMHARETALLIAARSGHRGVAEVLLEHHADHGLLDATHRGPLSHAAGAGHAGLVALLLERGAGLDPIDDQQRTPLHWAIAGGHALAAQALIDGGADVNHPCPKEPAGYTPLHRCVTVGGDMLKTAGLLRTAGADTSLRDPRDGKTAEELLAQRSA